MIRYIAAHWRGDNSLAYAYWVNGVILQALINGAITYVSLKTTYLNDAVSALSVFVAVLVESVWALVGIWRSAGNSIDAARRAEPSGSAFWAYAARCMVILGAARVVVEAVPALHDLQEMARIERSDIAQNYRIEPRGESDLLLEAYINKKSVRAVKKALSEDDGRFVLIMNGPGGLLVDAFELADFVEKNGIWVAAVGECQSSCLLVLAAGKVRVTTADAFLLFHHPEAAGDFVSEGAMEGMAEVTLEYYRRFERYGVPADRLNELKKAGQRRLTVGEAYNLYMVDQLWLPERGELRDLAEVCEKNNCFTSPMLITEDLTPLEQ